MPRFDVTAPPKFQEQARFYFQHLFLNAPTAIPLPKPFTMSVLLLVFLLQLVIKLLNTVGKEAINDLVRIP